MLDYNKILGKLLVLKALWDCYPDYQYTEPNGTYVTYNHLTMWLKQLKEDAAVGNVNAAWPMIMRLFNGAYKELMKRQRITNK